MPMLTPTSLRRLRTTGPGISALAIAMTTVAAPTSPAPNGPFERREADWRNGAIVYQVIVDRFVPSAHLEAKLAAHELDFWGGDLRSLATRLDHVQALGATVLYLNPIHLAYTNHKYDAFDFKAISPEYGTTSDFRQLTADVHRRGMKLVLDGVFNHMGRNAPKFQDAIANPRSPWRDWFVIGPQYAGGARVWTGFQNLPELNLENPAVRAHLWAAPDSVVRSLLREGADGWRLDTAYELGHRWLRELTDAAHREKPGSLVVGEIVNYPGEWLRSMDAVMNFSLLQIVLGLAQGEIAPARAARLTDRLVRDAGIEPMLKSWMVIDNHDIPRIATQLPDAATRRLVQVLQFTLPGAPNIYYGAELGMTGGADPENRGPMRWELLAPDNPELRWMRQLVALRQHHRALCVGDYRAIDTEALYAFERHTDRALETVLVVANPGDRAVTEKLMVANAHLMDDTPLVDALRPGEKPAAVFGPGFVTVTLPPRSVWVLTPQERSLGGYSRYKRVR